LDGVAAVGAAAESDRIARMGFRRGLIVAILRGVE